MYLNLNPGETDVTKTIRLSETGIISKKVWQLETSEGFSLPEG